MGNPKVSIIAAVSSNCAIGENGKMLWHIPGELKRFKDITTGHPIIMGRKTHESIGQPLPGRTNIVLTRDKNYQSEGIEVAHSLEEALRLASLAQGNNEVFVIGGGEIYKQALPLADKVYITVVEGDFSEADTFFPDYSDFKKVVFEKESEDAGYKFKFLELEK